MHVLALPALLLPGFCMAQDTITLRIASNLDPAHPVQRALAYMNTDLKERSGNTMQLVLYPGGQMGSATDTIQQVQIGALDMTKAGASDLEPFDPVFSVFDLPYLFKNKAGFHKVVYGPVGRRIMTEPAGTRGFFAIAAYEAGYRSFYAKKPLPSPRALRGLKVRVQSSPTVMQMIRLMGGAPTPIPFADTYTALEQGVVDVAENNIISFVDTRHLEICKYFSEDEHTSVPDYLIISVRTWHRLSPQQRNWLMLAARDSERYQNKLWDELTTVKRREAEKAGVHFIKVNKTPYQRVERPLYSQFRKVPWQAKLLDDIESAQNTPARTATGTPS